MRNIVKRIIERKATVPRAIGMRIGGSVIPRSVVNGTPARSAVKADLSRCPVHVDGKSAAIARPSRCRKRFPPRYIGLLNYLESMQTPKAYTWSDWFRH